MKYIKWSSSASSADWKSQDIFHKRCARKASCIALDSTHPKHGLFTLLPSGRRFHSIKARTTRLRESFFPQSIILFNSLPALPLHSRHT
ncbi:hypothetical protein XELAEV_18001942mg [Xenopus laevis]|nr:hypothetical protein XELAEV_18001942mg [Xenopus laevis]